MVVACASSPRIRSAGANASCRSISVSSTVAEALVHR